MSAGAETASWVDGVPDDSPFGVHNLPYGVFTTATQPEHRRIGVRIGDFVLDIAAVARTIGAPSTLLEAPSLNPLMAAGRPVWLSARAAISSWLTDPAHRAVTERHLVPLADATLHLPFEPADYVDFYASERHAINLGRMFR